MSDHVKTDPVCIHYKESGLFRRYVNERGRGKGCPVCVPAYKASPQLGVSRNDK